MRDGTFKGLHPVELDDDARALRGRQAARQAIAIKNWKDETEAKAEAWKAEKKARTTTEETMTADLWKTSRAAEEGVEERWVECEDRLMGGVVVSVRIDTGETTGSRNASHDELRGTAKPKSSGAPKAPDVAHLEPPTPEAKAKKLERLIREICARPRPETALLKALAKGSPEATAGEHKAALVAAIEEGVVVADGDKLVVAAQVQDADDGVVPDSYRPPTH